MPSQGGHRGLAHGRVLLPVFPLAVGLGALSAVGQAVAVLAAGEAFEDGDPQGFRALFLLVRHVSDHGLLFCGGAMVWCCRWVVGSWVVVVERSEVLCLLS